jgi:hypothetical protein
LFRATLTFLVASPAIAVGVNGLQQRCNHLIFLSLPWTYTAYEQIVGRICRTGSKFESVEVIIPQVLTTTSKTTYGTFRWEMIEIETKRTLTE